VVDHGRFSARVEEIWHVWMCSRRCELANGTLISGEHDLIVMEHVLNLVSVLRVTAWMMDYAHLWSRDVYLDFCSDRGLAGYAPHDLDLYQCLSRDLGRGFCLCLDLDLASLEICFGLASYRFGPEK
jgi:hypothetical protein